LAGFNTISYAFMLINWWLLLSGPPCGYLSELMSTANLANSFRFFSANNMFKKAALLQTLMRTSNSIVNAVWKCVLKYWRRWIIRNW